MLPIKDLDELLKLKRYKYKRLSGVYFISDWKDNIIYIGQSKSLFERIFNHRNKEFRFYRFIECEKKNLNLIEGKYIKKYKPKFNKIYSKKFVINNSHELFEILERYFKTLPEGEILLLKKYDKFIFKLGLIKYCFEMSDLPKNKIGMIQNYKKSFYIRRINNKLFINEI